MNHRRPGFRYILLICSEQQIIRHMHAEKRDKERERDRDREIFMQKRERERERERAAVQSGLSVNLSGGAAPAFFLLFFYRSTHQTSGLGLQTLSLINQLYQFKTTCNFQLRAEDTFADPIKLIHHHSSQ